MKSRVRLFRNDAGESVVVKSPLKKIKRRDYDTEEEFQEECARNSSFITQEVTFYKRAYPNEAPCHLSIMPHLNKKNEEVWTYRFIMPFMTCFRLDHCIQAHPNPETILIVMLAVALELKRLHEINMCHGDLSVQNIFVELNANQKSCKAHFIDFEYAYELTSEEAKTTRAYAPRWAPERRLMVRDSPKPKPHTSQDVYSLGFTLLNALGDKFSAGYPLRTFSDKFPDIDNLLTKSLEYRPDVRPALEEIIEEMAAGVNQFANI